MPIRTRPTHTVVFPMRTWRTERRIWHGRLPKKHWPFLILMRRRRRHGPIPRSAGKLFATARKTISSSLVRRVDKGVTSVRNRILEGPFRWLYQIEESYSNEALSPTHVSRPLFLEACIGLISRTDAQFPMCP